MKYCTDCRHANWAKTKSGRMHPSGDGMCGYVYELPPLPASMYWVSIPKPAGGYINRKEALGDHCVHFERKS